MTIKINWTDISFIKKKNFWIPLVASMLFTLFLVEDILYYTNVKANLFIRCLMGIPFIFLLFFKIHQLIFPKLQNPIFYKIKKGGKKK